MAPTYFPLRWESTGEQWWYASPIDWAAANGHYDLVRELLRLDNNHMINLTSLRRIRRVETVWDDEEQFDDVSKCRSQVARKLFLECESNRGKKNNSLIRAGYGGWLMYTAASAGDLSFVQELLQRNPLLVFGEGEYGVTDIFYAAARSNNSSVFNMIYDFAVSPRFVRAAGGELEENIGDVPPLYKLEMMNRAVHAAARGGNLTVLNDLLRNCADVFAFRDTHGSTILHAAAARGQAEVVKHLVSSLDIINSKDNQGNTALHTAAHRGQLSVVEALIFASPSLISATNNAGETFLHMAVSGFQTPAFRRLDRQVKLMKELLCGKLFSIQDIINVKNNEGRTALHVALIGNVDSHLVQLLMSARSINLNVRDSDGLTPLDLLKQRPHSASSDILIRQLIAAGGIVGSCHDYSARRAFASRLKMQGNGGSPGTSFRISDTEIFLSTGIEIASDTTFLSPDEAQDCVVTSISATETAESQHNSVNEKVNRKQSSMNYAAQRLKMILHWPRVKEGKLEKIKKAAEQAPVEPLRERFLKSTSGSTHKRALSNQSNSPTCKKKLALDSTKQATNAPGGRSRSSSFSRSSIASPEHKQKGICIDTDVAGPSSSNFEEVPPNVTDKHKKLRSQYFCFGGPGLSAKTPVARHRHRHSHSNSHLPCHSQCSSNPSILSVY